MPRGVAQQMAAGAWLQHVHIIIDQETESSSWKQIQEPSSRPTSSISLLLVVPWEFCHSWPIMWDRLSQRAELEREIPVTQYLNKCLGQDKGHFLDCGRLAEVTACWPSPDLPYHHWEQEEQQLNQQRHCSLVLYCEGTVLSALSNKTNLIPEFHPSSE